jgi:hypothetical protein
MFFIVISLFSLISVAADIPAVSVKNISDNTIQGAYDNPANFHFVVMGDRTGKEQKGVFGQVINKINLIRPAFVVSVGDAIDGYTDDPNLVNRQWDEFDSLVANLKVPFFAVPGNHDMVNDMMVQIYQKRRHKTYFHALYKKVLFLFINTDDPSAAIDLQVRIELDKEKKKLKEIALQQGVTPQTIMLYKQFEQKERDASGSKISDAQFGYFKKVLADNNSVRWTFVVMHKPVWKQSTPPANWLELEKILGSRPYTVFAGHEHVNSYTLRNNRDYIVMGTSGAGGLPDTLPGVYHHILWVTMDSNSPLIANLLADGILEKTDIRSFSKDSIKAGSN